MLLYIFLDTIIVSKELVQYLPQRKYAWKSQLILAQFWPWYWSYQPLCKHNIQSITPPLFNRCTCVNNSEVLRSIRPCQSGWDACGLATVSSRVGRANSHSCAVSMNCFPSCVWWNSMVVSLANTLSTTWRTVQLSPAA